MKMPTTQMPMILKSNRPSRINLLLLEDENRKTRFGFGVILSLWCFFTLFACCTLVLYLNTKFSEDQASKVAVDLQKFSEMMQDNMRTLIDKEIQKMKNEMHAKFTAINNDLNPTDEHGHQAAAARTEQDIEFDPVEQRNTYEINNDENDYMDDDNGEQIDQTQGFRIFKRNVELIDAQKPKVIGNSEGTGGQSLRLNNRPTQEENKENKTSNTNILSRFHRNSSNNNQQVGVVQTRANVPVKSKRSSHSEANGTDAENENEVITDSHKSSDFRGPGKQPNVLTAESLTDEDITTEVKVVVAAHLGADSSSFKKQKQFYLHNDLVRHPTGNYLEWKFDNWYLNSEMFRHVNISNGRIIIQHRGPYFVYGQIYFTERADINGYIISRNNEAVLQCVTSFSGDTTKEASSNSCFTGGIVFCEKGDELSMRGVHPGRSVVLEKTKSFFGMFKLAEASLIVS